MDLENNKQNNDDTQIPTVEEQKIEIENKDTEQVSELDIPKEEPESKYEWSLGLTGADKADGKNTNANNHNIVKTFTGYTLQFKTWNKKQQAEPTSDIVKS